MILTGRAKEDFYKWFDNYSQEHHHKEWLENDLYLDEVYLPSTILHALIIEWFDSVGIYINVSPNYLDHARKYSEGDFKAIINFKDGSNTISVDLPFESCFNPYNRQEATKQAIIKANYIYNEIYNESKN